MLSKAGTTEFLRITFALRTDVEGQDRGNIDDVVFKNKETGEYNARRLNNLCKSAGIPEGTVFQDVDDLLKQLEGANLRIVVKTMFDDYKQKEVNKISYFKPTAKPLAKLNEANPPKAQDGTKPKIEIKDEDLPW
jgi:hypothetical protein